MIVRSQPAINSGKVFVQRWNLAGTIYQPKFKGNKGLFSYCIQAKAGNVETMTSDEQPGDLEHDRHSPAAFDLMAQDLMAVIQNEGADEGRGDQTELLQLIEGQLANNDSAQWPVLRFTTMVMLIANATGNGLTAQKLLYERAPLGLSRNSFRNDIINWAFEGFSGIKKLSGRSVCI